MRSSALRLGLNLHDQLLPTAYVSHVVDDYTYAPADGRVPRLPDRQVGIGGNNHHVVNRQPDDVDHQVDDEVRHEELLHPRLYGGPECLFVRFVYHILTSPPEQIRISISLG